MKKLSLIIGAIVIVLLVLFIITQTNGDKRLSNINPSNFEIKYGTINKWVSSGINAKNIKNINVTEEGSQYGIMIELNDSGQQILKEITSGNIGKQVGIFIRDKAISAPTITQTMDTPFISIGASTNEEALVLKEDILNETLNPNAFYIIKSVGRSMEEYAIFAGQDVKIYYNQICMPGDNCSFQCLVDKCICSEDACTNDGNFPIKRLVSINNNCYWFEGNSKPIIEGDIGYKSFDSRTYGCLVSSEFKMEGVAK